MGYLNLGNFGKNGKYAQFWALLKLIEPLHGSHRGQKLLQYIPELSKYLRETFECIRYMGDPNKYLK